MLSGVFRPASALHLALGAALCGSLAVSACSRDGRALAPVDPDYTTTSGPIMDAALPMGQAGSQGAGADGDAPSFLLSSEGFTPGSELAAAYTCAGAGVSPPLSWTTPPPGAELAIVMREHVDQGTVHWIVTGIDPAVTGFGEGGIPEGAVQQVNATGTTGYFAPCPAAGTGPHSYDISLHLLEQPLTVDGTEAAPDLAARIETLSVHEAPLTAIVST